MHLNNDHPTCRSVLERWASPGCRPPHLLIAQPPHGGCGADLLIAELSRLYHANHVRGSNLARSSLLLKFPREAIPLERRKFFDSPRVAAEFRNAFSGVFAMDISEWPGAYDSPEFGSLLDFISENASMMQFIFLLNHHESRTIERSAAVLARRIRLQTLIIHDPDLDLLLRHAEDCFRQQGYELTETGLAEVKRCLRQMPDWQDFQGFLSVEKLVAEVIDSQIAAGDQKSQLIDENGLTRAIVAFTEQHQWLESEQSTIGY